MTIQMDLVMFQLTIICFCLSLCAICISSEPINNTVKVVISDIFKNQRRDLFTLNIFLTLKLFSPTALKSTRWMCFQTIHTEYFKKSWPGKHLALHCKFKIVTMEGIMAVFLLKLAEKL